MRALSLSEAQLFRILTSFFGDDRVLIGLTVMCVCGGEVPQPGESLDIDAAQWASNNTCLFTIVNGDDTPRMVMEFCDDFEDTVVPEQAEHQRFLRPILAAKGVPYVTISTEEFCDLTDPSGTLDFYSLLKEKVEEFGLGL